MKINEAFIFRNISNIKKPEVVFNRFIATTCCTRYNHRSIYSAGRLKIIMYKVTVLLLLVFVSYTQSWGRRRRSPPCSPRPCQVSSWSTWSPCSHQCGTSGTQTRARTKTVVEACGGSCPYHLSVTRSCNTDKCQNSGTPTSNGCSCPPGYNGTCCEIGK